MKKTGMYLFYGLVAIGLCWALFTRLGLIVTERLWPDEALYASYAAQIFTSPWFIFSSEVNTHHSALFPSILALGHFFQNSLIGDRIMVASFNFLTILAVFWLGKRMFGVFAGGIAALIMAGNSFYLIQSNLILIDGPLAMGHVFFAMAVWVFISTGRKRAGILAGLLGILLVFLKWYAAFLIIPWFVITFLWSRRVTQQKMKDLYVPLGMILLVFIPYVFFKVIPVLKSGGPATFFPSPFWYYFIHFQDLIGGAAMTIIFLASFFFLLEGDVRKQALLIPWVIVELAVLSLVSQKDLRYILPLLPCVVIVMGAGIASAVDILFKKEALRDAARCAVAVIFLVPVLTLAHQPMAWSINHNYLGFLEAGEVIKTLDDGKAVVLAGSIRALRFASGIREKEFGGRLEALPKTLQELKERVSLARTKIILEVDIWEYIQPAWVYPVTSEKLEAIRTLGFIERKAIVRRVSGGRERWVAWVFEYIPK